jgi:Kef-type K+ transport system membrane component KefB
MVVVEQMTMDWLDAFRSHAVALPNLAKFAIVMAIVAAAPALARRLRVPEIVGLLAFGVLIGPYVLDVAPRNYPIVQFFGDLGRLLLLFTAGLEIDISLFRKAQTRSVYSVSSRPSCPSCSVQCMVWRSAMG